MSVELSGNNTLSFSAAYTEGIIHHIFLELEQRVCSTAIDYNSELDLKQSLESSGMYCCVVKQMLIDVSEVRTASIIRTMSEPCAKR
jgi:hypothetical protein